MDLNERIARYLSQVPPAISGQGGHNQTFSLACALYNGFALPESEVLEWLKMYNSRCQPPWSDKELEHKTKSASSAQHTKARGHLVGGNGTFKKEDFHYVSFQAKEQPKAATLDPSTEIEKFLKGFRCGEIDISEASPIRLSDEWVNDGPLLLSHLYSESELVNYVTDYKLSEMADGTTKAVPNGYGESHKRVDLVKSWSAGVPQSDAGGWLRMNPVDGKGIADANISDFRFILLEFDSIPLDSQNRSRLPIIGAMTPLPSNSAFRC